MTSEKIVIVSESGAVFEYYLEETNRKHRHAAKHRISRVPEKSFVILLKGPSPR